MAQFTYTSNAPIHLDDLETKHTTIDVYGLAGKVTSTSVGIEGFTHSDPADIDMLLVGPGKHNLAFMTDASGTIDANGIDFSFSDAGAPLVFPLADGEVYKPADGGESEFASNWGLANLTIQHPNSGATFASAFNGINGNGKWSLYVHDDAAIAEGGISGWNLTVKTAETFALLNGTGGDDKINVLTTNALGGEGVFQINERGAVVFKGATFFKINAGAGNDWVVGDKETDSINAGAGQDSVYGGSGNDYISIGMGSDEAGEVYDGGSGSDWIFKETYQTLDLRDDTVKSIEILNLKAGGTMQINAAPMSQVQTVLGAVDITHPDVLQVTMGASTYVNLGSINFSNFVQAGDKVVVRGDGAAEYILGSKMNDVIKAGGGDDLVTTNLGLDSVDGGNGSDTVSYLTRNVAVQVTLDGSDKVGVKLDGLIKDSIKNVENVTGGSANDILRGDSLANVLKGSDGADRLKGFGGHDKLEGGIGADLVWGGAGKDKFVFANAIDAVDHIKDFSHADDTIVLDNAVFAAFANVGTINAKKFVANASGHEAYTAKQKLIYDRADHSLWYDADGNGAGAAVEIATFDNKIKNLDYSDFLIV